MSNIPTPIDPTEIPPDQSQAFLEQWKKLFTDIDPDNFTVTIKGDKDFPDSYSFPFSESRLSDGYNVDVQLYISINSSLFHKIGGNVCCCLQRTSFITGWIFELDENLDSMNEEPITWAEMYQRLVEIVIRYRQKIPDPSEVFVKDESK